MVTSISAAGGIGVETPIPLVLILENVTVDPDPIPLIAFLAFLGDLLESYLKRDLGIKDSGKVIPGHGGVMDRFDGYFLILPLYNFYLFGWF